MAITKKTVRVELAFIGSGRVIERPKGSFRGGVPSPKLSPHAGFNVLPLSEEEDGSRIPDSASMRGRLQVNFWGTSDDFRALGRYLLSIAELDTSIDPAFHQHHDDVATDDGHMHIDLVVRKVRGPAV